MKIFPRLAALASAALAAASAGAKEKPAWRIPPSLPVIGERSVQSVLDEIDAASPAPPSRAPEAVAVLVFKREGRMETYADGKKISTYRLAAPCKPGGPKLCEGDGLLPEGFYRFDVINTSAIHDLALQISYPSDEDRACAVEDGRCTDRDGPADLGGDVCVHGGTNTGSCIPLGPEIRRFFREIVYAGAGGAKIVIAPYDMRSGRDRETDALYSAPWYARRLDAIEKRLKDFPAAE